MARQARITNLVLSVVSTAIFPALASERGGPAVLQLDPVLATSKQERFPGIFAEWSDPDAQVEDAPVVAADESDPYGCSKQQKCVGCALYVQQGECPFEQKAKMAEAAKAKLLIVGAKKDGPPVGMALSGKPGPGAPTISAVMISKASGRKLTLALDRGEVFKAQCRKAAGGYADIMSELLVGVLAVALVSLGAWYSVEDLRRPGEQSHAAEECLAVEEHSGPHFVLFGSLMLTILFFFMKYLIYVLLLMFAAGAISATAVLLEPVIAGCFPKWRDTKACTVPQWLANQLGVAEEHSLSDVCAEVVGGVLAVLFLIYRNNPSFGWVFQDIIAIMLLLTIQRSLRLPNLKIATTMLVCTFFFDIFWVFISPLIFKKSVMIEVATGGGTGQSVPMVLKIPALGGDFPGQHKILGLGDIAIPGLLISFLLRHDLTKRHRRCSGYFTWGVIGYALGLLCTFISLYLMRHGQPALLFLVPGTLIPTFVIAHRKGELMDLWTADYSPPPPEGYQELPDSADKHA